MLKLNFTKMHGLGNDFVVIDLRKKSLCIHTINNLANITLPNAGLFAINLTTKQIKFICERKLGIGCDQLLLIKDNPNNNSQDFDYIYQIFNADGTEAEQCGNGARCCIKYLIDTDSIPIDPILQQNNINDTKNDTNNNKNIYNTHSTYEHGTCEHGTINNPIRLKSSKQIITGYLLSDKTIAVHLGIPHFEPSSLPCTHESEQSRPDGDGCYHIRYNTNLLIRYGIVSVGNPHVVIQLNSLNELHDTEYLTGLAQFIQNSKRFPQGVNVNFYVIESNHTNNNSSTQNNTPLIHLANKIYLRTYERGCGFTNACGTGATATVSYGVKHGILDHTVQVHMNGGILSIKSLPNTELIMIGDANTVFTGQIVLV